ncbi:MAG: hypothetical protein ACW98D_14075 [Promethearchaeota archaeon]|jgi:hypothetical protein
MVFKDEVKNERKKVYFDLLCGIVFTTITLIGVYIVNDLYGILNRDGWYIGMTFIILYLILCLSLLGLGIYNKWRENRPQKIQPKKKLKAPLVS